MCGIFFAITCNECKNPHIDVEECLEVLRRRGPDCSREETVDLSDVTCKLVGNVLWMQGDRPTPQPLLDEFGNFMLWNGECFNQLWPEDSKSDSTKLMEAFSQAASPEETLHILSRVRGPFSFVYWPAGSRHVFFGRDRIGRHSLLWHKDRGKMVLTSVGVKKMVLEEVPTLGMFSVDVRGDLNCVVLYPWSDSKISQETLPQSLFTILVSHSTIESPIVEPASPLQPPSKELSVYKQFADKNMSSHEILDQLLLTESVASRVDGLLRVLRASVKVRVETQPKLCRDCVKIADCRECKHAKIGVLFSGGLDSALLVLLADEFVPIDEPIDLINVAFERPKKPNIQDGEKKRKPPKPMEGLVNTDDGYNVPDRKTGRQTLEELVTLRPDRQWNFIETNVTQAELTAERKSRIAGLIHPLDSVLDDSLGCALWFAARGRGRLNTLHRDKTGDQDEVYESSTRVLLLGMGADEQMGGYMRHRTILAHHCWKVLALTMAQDVANIAVRNLGRDDRIVADSGRQGRLPYLDEDVVNFLNRLRPWHKCVPIPSLPSGVGDKVILRLAVRSLGLKNASLLPKRAFQFGSRIANSKEKGGDKCERLNTTP